MRTKFLDDLDRIKEKKNGENMKAELREDLRKMRRRLDDPNIISANVVSAMLIAFRYYKALKFEINVTSNHKVVWKCHENGLIKEMPLTPQNS